MAEELWLLIGVVTFALVSLAGIAGSSGLAGAIAIIGWFLLTPIFLFWGEEIASQVYDKTESEPLVHNSGDDALGELKRRYVEGEIDDDEFAHRLDQLLEVDAPDHVFTATSKRRVGTSESNSDQSNRREMPKERPSTEDDVQEREWDC